VNSTKYVAEFIGKNLFMEISELDLIKLAKCVEADLNQALRMFKEFDDRKRREIARDIAELIIKKCRNRETDIVNFVRLLLMLMHVPLIVAFLLQRREVLAQKYNNYLSTAFGVPYLVVELKEIIESYMRNEA